MIWKLQPCSERVLLKAPVAQVLPRRLALSSRVRAAMERWMAGKGHEHQDGAMNAARPQPRADHDSPALVAAPPRRLLWLGVHLGIGFAWIALLASRAGDGQGIGASGSQVLVMLLLAGWLPSWALACWQVRRRRWRALLASDLMAAGLLVLLAVTAYLPLFFVNVVWFLPLALLPRGLCTELLLRRLVSRRG